MRTLIRSLLGSLALVACTGTVEDDVPTDDTDTDTDAVGSTDETDDTTEETDDTTEETDEEVIDNPSELTVCPALVDLLPDQLCADISGYGVAMFDIWQARSNVMDSRTDEPAGQQDYVGIQLPGLPNGNLTEGTYTCAEFPGFIDFGMPGTAPNEPRWRTGSEAASCTITFTAVGHISEEASGSFSGTMERYRGAGPAERTITGVFRLHGEAPATAR